MCWLETMTECDAQMESDGGFLQQTIHFSVPYATTKIRLDEFIGANEIAFSVEFIGFNNNKRLNIFDPMQGGFATTSIFDFFAHETLSFNNFRNSEFVSCARFRWCISGNK